MIEHVQILLIQFAKNWVNGWNRFWFSASSAETLGILRIFSGAMLFYTHAVWTLDFEVFIGPESIFTIEFLDAFHARGPAWSIWNWIESPSLALSVHFVGLAIVGAFTIGLFTRVSGILSFLLLVSYCNRASAGLFGLDQISAFLVFYLAIGPSGLAYSVDNWWRKSRGVAQEKSIFANVTIRMIQINVCIVYLFAGMAKLKGYMWWDGTATWYTFASYDYQSMDMTWLVDYPFITQMMTHITVAWEVSYAFLVWNRMTRPVYLLVAVFVHLGIGICMGMMTFGLIMIVANMAFVSPKLFRAIFERNPKLLAEV